MNFQTEDDYVQFFNNNSLETTDTMQIILNKFCFNHNNNIIIDYKIFKNIASILTYDMIFKHLENVITNTTKNLTNDTLQKNNVNIHLSMKSLSITDVDKHRNFISNLINYYNLNYPNYLNGCYIYLASSIFKQVFSIFSIFIDKETKKKIHIVEKHRNKQTIDDLHN